MHHIMSDYTHMLLADIQLTEAREQAAHDTLARDASTAEQHPARNTIRATFSGMAAVAVIVLIAIINRQ